MFKRLLAAFKGLPPEMRMLLAMAGLATPLGLIYVLQRAWKYLFGKPIATFTLMIGLAVLVGALALIGLLFSKIWGRGASKRKKKMESELASGSEAGLASIDLRAAIKSNNEKFFTAIREMRKNAGISVYDLPWYIIIGDSGCGKTKLINESGLVFSTGKPEGYQLGTLNYNWWFTEDAVFIDMAGRLCNPQDDGDRREWIAFLDTVGRGRRGYPINGAIVCVSAEHLLQDSPEKHEQDANTALERLRDLQNKLGVTFATHLVVTKCDKILGFMQFFDRAGRDITIKNQIFGWSRPGDFSELYDPESFGNDFDGIYRRLNEVRLRRLADDADEVELGLAYSFPEEFRELQAPLQTYVRTLFPMIKTPRAIKNLIFRGAYFTSATQVGGLILKHLTERLGAGAADQFAPLESLYPQPRPHFVKDLLARKVIPEHGLVFRNERQVVRNRKLSRLLKIGSTALGVIIIAALTWSVWSFGNLIGTPREDARKAPSQIEAPRVALAGVEALSADVDRLVSRPWPARILSLGIGAGQPIRDLTRIRMHLFEEGVLRQMLVDVDRTLQAGGLRDPRGGDDAVKAATAYIDALEQFMAWYGCMNETSPPAELKYDNFRKLGGVLSLTDEFYHAAGIYFTTLHGAGGNWPNPARLLADKRIQPRETIRQAIVHVHNYLSGYATLTADHPDPTIREWVRIHDACTKVMDNYDTMLQASTRDIATQKELQEFKEAFVGAYDNLATALGTCTWKGGGNPVRIGSLKEAILRQRERWVDCQARLDKALRVCHLEPNTADIEATVWLTTGDRTTNKVPGLDLVLAKNLQDLGLADKSYWDGFFGEHYPTLVKEVYERNDHLVMLQPHAQEYENDQVGVAAQAQAVQGVLRSIRDELAAADFEAKGDLSNEVPSNWPGELERLLTGQAAAAPTTAPEGLDKKWRPSELTDLQARYASIIVRGRGTLLLTTIAARLTQGGEWGLAELYPNWREKSQSAYQIQIPAAPSIAAPQPPAPDKPSTPSEPTIRRPGEAAPPAIRRPGETAKPAEVRPLAVDLAGLIPTAATQAFLNQRAWDCVQLKIYLDQFTDAYYLPGSGENSELNRVCLARLETAGRAYTDAYVKNWATAYTRKNLALLDRLRQERAKSWTTLADALSERRSPGDADPREIGRELQAALQEILQSIPWATYAPDRGWWKNQTDKEWTDCAAWVLSSLRDDKNGWPAQHGKFITEAQQVSTDVNPAVPPWMMISQAFDRAWMDIAAGIVNHSRLPREFNETTKEQAEIPWHAVQKLREDTRLTDEKLTAQFVAFTQQGQTLLSAELTTILNEVQERHLTNLTPYGGWPYLNASGEQLTALEAVPYKQFKDFLTEVGEATRVLAPLERGIPDDDPLKMNRHQLYRSCQAWRTFIGFTADPGKESDLKVEVRYIDPLDPTLPGGLVENIDDTAQNYYDEVHLSLGLAIQDPNQPGGVSERAPLKISTRLRGDAGLRTAWWRWEGGGSGSTLKMQLAGGIQGEGKKKPYPDTIHPIILGTASPLALCAYLHRYASYDEQNGVWVSAHAIDLAEAFKQAGTADLIPPDGKTRMGAKFTFKLDRPMPSPIQKLEKAAQP